MSDRPAGVPEVRTLEAVLDWARTARLGPPALVTQDEYTHDVVLPWHGGRYLVFDTS